jgi:RHH-type proline utilization regulon transcriptional repressor/proline dehydrogenase/delta 1-pyrroline-5-carboxylate dehydrogenase
MDTLPPQAKPFAAFARSIQPQTALQSAINAAHRAPEAECVARLLPAATLTPAQAAQAEPLARRLVAAIRAKPQRGGVEGLVREYALSSQEGVALMCLAEALLRIPDIPTRDALIRDKISKGNWQAHLGHSPSWFVNAATWGLLVTGKLTATSSEAGLTHALTRLISRGGEPLIRQGVNLAMRLMGEQFVTGETIAQALAHARPWEAKGFRYSYDMLGEAAMTAADAARYYAEYEQAIHAIGQAAGRRGLYEGPGISIKLSALHPRYSRQQRERVFTELLPRLTALTALAKQYDIGLNVDAEEADRLALSLDLLEALCLDPDFAGWNGIGFVVQAYQKRAPFVLDFVIDLARRSQRRIMLRLVKGAYWDSEIKRAQQDGLADFPVYTRKAHTDVSYLACARKLLDARASVFPQFATHNAQTLASIVAMAGEDFTVGDYEFQCLHGMGEPLYEEVVGPQKLGRPCRVYAPVGTHKTLLAYLVRRLLENGANSSFINRIADPLVPIDALIADPAVQVREESPVGAPHPAIALPPDLFADRRNAAGYDLSNEEVLRALSTALLSSAETHWRAAPMLGEPSVDGHAEDIRNPADRSDRVGSVIAATSHDVEMALRHAVTGVISWAAMPVLSRAACLTRAAELMEVRGAILMGLMVREAGKSLPNAVAEWREAIDFLRYYAAQITTQFSNDTHRPLGVVLCISPWNFPLAIFTGQIAAALAAGNSVIAKPAEETPLIAAQAIQILREAGIPAPVLQCLPGDGALGAMLVADSRVQGVVFTGSTEVARLIQSALANRLNPDGAPVPLIAETGGQNAMLVDSSALTEQVVADVIVSAFDSAGQRCSALRVLSLQEDIADHTLTMLKGALDELQVGPPEHLATDIGPVITEQACASIQAHIAHMRQLGRRVHQLALPELCQSGSFVPPTIIELRDLSELHAEVFGPVLHVIRYKREQREALLDALNATGYSLTFGLHTRMDETIASTAARIDAGNVYINRNIVGAVVGVQPFGGNGLSGTGPKAGGPLYLRRVLSACPAPCGLPAGKPHAIADRWMAWLLETGRTEAAAYAQTCIDRSLFGVEITLPGSVGESNQYSFRPRGVVGCVSASEAALLRQISAVLATGNRAMVCGPLPVLPATLSDAVCIGKEDSLQSVSVVLSDCEGEGLRAQLRALAAASGPIVPLYIARHDPVSGESDYPLEWLMHERSTSTNTAAAGGNASLMMIG